MQKRIWGSEEELMHRWQDYDYVLYQYLRDGRVTIKMTKGIRCMCVLQHFLIWGQPVSLFCAPSVLHHELRSEPEPVLPLWCPQRPGAEGALGEEEELRWPGAGPDRAALLCTAGAGHHGQWTPPEILGFCLKAQRPLVTLLWLGHE